MNCRSYSSGFHKPTDLTILTMRERNPDLLTVLFGSVERMTMLMANEKFLSTHLCWGKNNICSAFAFLAETLTRDPRYEDGMNPGDKAVLNLLASNPSIGIGRCGQESPEKGEATPHFLETMARQESPYLDYVRTLLVRRQAGICMSEIIACTRGSESRLETAFMRLGKINGAALTRFCLKDLINSAKKGDFPFFHHAFAGASHVGPTPVTPEVKARAALFLAATSFEMAVTAGKIEIKPENVENAKANMCSALKGSPYIPGTAAPACSPI